MPWRSKSGASVGSVHADQGGVAVGRDIHDSTIHIGLDEQEIARLLEEKFAPLVDHWPATRACLPLRCMRSL